MFFLRPTVVGLGTGNPACFVPMTIAELGKLPRTMIDFAGFAAKGVAVVGPTYVNDYLLSDPPPKVEGHLIDEFKPFWSKRKTVGQF